MKQHTLKLIAITLGFLLILISKQVQGQNWNEVTSFTSPEGNLSRAVFTDGEYVLTGVPQEDVGGVVFLYKKNVEGNWVLVKEITPDSPQSGSDFGFSVSMSGDYIIVGAPEYEDAVHNRSIGAIYIFYKDQGGTDQWGQVANFSPADVPEPEDGRLGHSVSISNGIALASEDGSTRRAFLLDISNGWQPTDTLKPANEEYGRIASVSIDGPYAAVGDVRASVDTSGLPPVDYAGAVYIFEDLDANGSYEEMARVQALDPHRMDQIGLSLELDGNNLVVGARNNDFDAEGNDSLYSSGAAYIFNVNQGGTGNWGQVAKLVESPRERANNFGETVSISGDYVLVGTPNEDEDTSGQDSIYTAGAGYMYHKDSAGQWQFLQKIVSPDRSYNHRFGNSVSVKGDNAILGSNDPECYLFKNHIQASNIGLVHVRKTVFGINIGLVHVRKTVFGITFQPGNGDGRVVFIKEGIASAAQPRDTIDYNPNFTFGLGDEITGQPGYYCVADTTGNSVFVHDLDTGTTYTVTVSEYTLNEKGHKIYDLKEVTGNPVMLRTLIELSGVGIHVGNKLLTATTTEMQFSLNSTDGNDGEWLDCTEGSTTSEFIPGNVYIRDDITPSNFRMLLTIPARAAAPSFTINYLSETTVEEVPATIEYNFDNNFTTSNLNGAGTYLDLIPDTTCYLRTRANDTTFASNILTLVIPDRPSAPNFTIDYKDEETSEVIANTYEYSGSPDMSGAVGGIFNPISLTPGTDVYIRSQATVTAFSGHIQHLDVPGRPPVPIVSLSDKNSISATFMKSLDGSGDKVATSDGYAYSTDNGSNWYTILDVTTVDASGNNHIIVRKNATASSFKTLSTTNLDSDKPVAVLISTNGCIGPDESIEAQSSIDNGNLYIVLDSELQNTVDDFENAIGSSKGAKIEINASNTPVYVSTEGLAPGVYSAYAVNNLDSISDISTTSVTLYENPVVDLGSDIVKCEVTVVTIDAGPGYAEYLWSFEAATTRSVNVSAEYDYHVTVTDDHGCSNSDTISVKYNIPYQEEQICIVTVDVATGKNMVVWEKTTGKGIQSYNLYRDEDELIGNVPYEDLSIFKDTVADPESRPFLYSISAVDTCGNESAQSPYHKPLFLQYVSSIDCESQVE